MGFEFLLRVDPLSIFMACVSGVVTILIYIYSIGYMSEYEHKTEFFGFMTLFLFSMMGLIFSANLLLMYIFWEITAFCSWRLIGFYRKEDDLEKANKAFLVTFFGASVMLVGFVLIYLEHGTLNLHELQGANISNLVYALILTGIFSKSAQLPLSSWLPDAGVAPTPVTALLHAAVLVKIGVYAYARLFTNVFVISAEAKFWLLVIVAVSGLVAALSALRETNIKRILAYSTISQLSYIFIAFAINSDMAIKAGLFYILVHSFAKAGLFLTAGIVEHSTHTKDLNSLGGLMKPMPFAAFSFLLCAFSIMGLPPFGGFFSKFYVVLATASAGYMLLAAVAMFTAVVTLLYLMRLFNGMFLGELKTKPAGKFSLSMASVVVICGIISLFIGLYFEPLWNITGYISQMMVR